MESRGQKRKTESEVSGGIQRGPRRRTIVWRQTELEDRGRVQRIRSSGSASLSWGDEEQAPGMKTVFHVKMRYVGGFLGAQGCRAGKYWLFEGEGK